ncbi:hypothetical protein pb186bvf_008699 [Paramecium bursaria]
MSDNEQPIIKPHQKSDKDYYAEHLQANEETDQQAPLLVVVQGPKQVGKSTLIKSLVKHYVGQKIRDPQGPITIRAKQRITFIECPSDINAMIDLAKVADLALIMIDASIGFEMETFEFLSLLNNHGFPNVMGVLTHIDFFKDNKQLRKTRKKYKKRFEYETGGNYKLFYLSALKNDYYLKQDIINLARFISIIKITPVRWKTDHPFILVDRYEEQEEKTTFFGYVRGCTYRINDRMHLVGSGDYYIESFEEVNDPAAVHNKGMRSLKDNEKLIYAPMSNVGFIDSNNGFIKIQKPIFTDREQQDDEEEIDEEVELQDGVQMVRDLQNIEEGIDLQLEQGDDIELLDGMVIEEEIKKVKNNKLTQQRELVRLKNRINFKIENKTILPINDQLLATDLHELIYQSKEQINNTDSNRFIPKVKQREEYLELKSQFVTGFYDVEDLENGNQEQQMEVEEESDDDKKKKEQPPPQIDFKQKQEELKQRQEIVNQNITSNLGLYKRGTYVKIVLKNVQQIPQLPNPIILARIDIGEDNLGFLKVKIKKHRWHSNILKSNDPIIMSLGWKRFQTMPVYCVQDQNDRLRFIKYTPEYDYCFAVFYGNFTPQGSGLVCTQTLSNKLSKFRLAATGVVLELNHSFNVVKKLKLIGEPFKIMKNTAFVKGMFNSSLEVSKFQGAMIKTVSGLRGHIKKPCKLGPDGSYRATFEDKISLSDLVFCRTWVRVDINRFYRLVGQKLMRTGWEIRQEKQINAPVNPDSVYKDIERNPVKFNPLKIPTRLQQSLPFQSREKVQQLSLKDRIRKQVEKNLPVKSELTDREKQTYSMIQRLNTIKNDKEQTRKLKDIQKNKIKTAQEQGQKKHLEQAKKKFKQQKQKEKFQKKLKNQED